MYLLKTRDHIPTNISLLIETSTVVNYTSGKHSHIHSKSWIRPIQSLLNAAIVLDNHCIIPHSHNLLLYWSRGNGVISFWAVVCVAWHDAVLLPFHSNYKLKWAESWAVLVKTFKQYKGGIYCRAIALYCIDLYYTSVALSASTSSTALSIAFIVPGVQFPDWSHRLKWENAIWLPHFPVWGLALFTSLLSHSLTTLFYCQKPKMSLIPSEFNWLLRTVFREYCISGYPAEPVSLLLQGLWYMRASQVLQR